MRHQLKIRTEYSFRTVYGPIEKVVDRLATLGCQSAAITDRNSTFGHVAWNRECNRRGIKPLFGVELSFTDIEIKQRRQNILWATVIAKSQAGLKEIYSAVEEATSQFYMLPRLSTNRITAFSQDVIVLLNGLWQGGQFSEAHPYTKGGNVPVSDNYMIEPTDRAVYEAIVGRLAFNRPSPMHILDQYDFEGVDFLLAQRLAEECDVRLPVAENVKIDSPVSLRALCLAGARRRGLELTDPYVRRLEHELGVIQEKQFEDYFFVLIDLISWAKQHMLVGPARGSSCGSLVCYLTGITDIDPLPHGLIFERFIDITRKDLPDIDVDFQDTKRELAFQYLTEKYGAEHVARLGTISRYKPRSAIGEAAKLLNIPPWETAELKDAVSSRNVGDERAKFCIADAFDHSEIGQAFIKKHPAMAVAARMEAHARHHGMHAAGVVITDKPLINYVARDIRANTIQIDKNDAETINLLKIDALGIKTLSIIADCLESVDMTHEQLLAIPLDCDDAFSVLRNKFWCGIFQFEGDALQTLAGRMHIDRFSDISALTALARPGPLSSGAANEWLARRMGRQEVFHYHTLTEQITAETYGLIIYQEQVMRIAREVGLLSWADTSTLRKTVAKSIGVEAFDRFWTRFLEGALSQGLDEILARRVWDNINTMGNYSFNKSHAVAYGMLSYWCCYLKARHPLEFALAYLKHTQDSGSVIRYLRELDRAGQKFKPYDYFLSQKDWSIKNGMLIGGLLAVKGIGPKTADKIIALRAEGKDLPPELDAKLFNGVTAYDNVFEVRRKFADLLARPQEHGIKSKLIELIDIGEERDMTVVFIAKMIERIKRTERGIWLNLILEDDTASIPASIGKYNFDKLGKPLLNEYKLGDWFVVKGSIKKGSRRVFVERYRPLV